MVWWVHYPAMCSKRVEMENESIDDNVISLSRFIVTASVCQPTTVQLNSDK